MIDVCILSQNPKIIKIKYILFQCQFFLFIFSINKKYIHPFIVKTYCYKIVFCQIRIRPYEAVQRNTQGYRLTQNGTPFRKEATEETMDDRSSITFSHYQY